MKKIYDYVEVQNALEKNFCDNLINSLNQKKWDSHSWSNEKGQTVDYSDDKNTF